MIYNYDYHFIIKELGEEFEGKYSCIGENNKKYITFSVLTEKEVIRIDKKGKQITKTISYRLQFIDSAKFMSSSLSNLANNLAEGIPEIKCKYRHDDKKCETCGIKCRYCDCFLEYTNFKDDLTEYKYLCCIHTNFLTMISISLFYCCKKVFTLMNT